MNARARLTRTLTVASMIIALVAVVFPRVSASIRGSDAGSAVDALVQDLDWMEEQASLQQAPLRIVFDSTGLQYTVSDRATGKVLRQRSLGPQSGFGITALTAVPSTIEVTNFGFRSSAFVVTLTAPDGTQRVHVSRMGLVRLER